jgi:hypothetical protein
MTERATQLLYRAFQTNNLHYTGVGTAVNHSELVVFGAVDSEIFYTHSISSACKIFYKKFLLIYL